MPKRTSTLKRLDTVQNARRVVEESIQRSEVNLTVISGPIISRVMADMGRKGGRIGGKRRLVTLSDKRRREIATKAAKARWAKAKKSKRQFRAAP
jgi:hypothetical protein